SVPLGSQTYGNVVVANGQIYVGTNNAGGRLERLPPTTDLAVLLCLRESDGSLLWQFSSRKVPTGRAHDWELVGLCSSPVVEDDRLWFVSNRAEVVCLDTNGFHDDEDDGPVTGVWDTLFEVITDLSKLFDAPFPFGLPANYEFALRSIVTGLNTNGDKLPAYQ